MSRPLVHNTVHDLQPPDLVAFASGNPLTSFFFCRRTRLAGPIDSVGRSRSVVRRDRFQFSQTLVPSFEMDAFAMLLYLLITLATAALSLSNVFSTFKKLRNGNEETDLRIELQFWGVYVLVLVLSDMVGWMRGDGGAPLMKLVLSFVLVVVKHLDTEHAVITSVFNVAEQAMRFLDEHFVTPNCEKFLLRPCTHLVEFTLQTVRQSKSLSDEDRAEVAAAIRQSGNDIRDEIVRRDKARFAMPVAADTPPASPGFQAPAADDDRTAEDVVAAGAESSSAPAGVVTPPRARGGAAPARARGLTFAALQRYFAQHGVVKTAKQIAQVLEVFQGRDAELRSKLQSKYGAAVEDQAVPAANLSTPQSAGTIGRSSAHADEPQVGPFTDNVMLRRRAAAVH